MSSLVRIGSYRVAPRGKGTKQDRKERRRFSYTPTPKWRRPNLTETLGSRTRPGLFASMKPRFTVIEERSGEGYLHLSPSPKDFEPSIANKRGKRPNTKES
ncbi:unnamed protein product [Cochlearia groenlandica]